MSLMKIRNTSGPGMVLWKTSREISSVLPYVSFMAANYFLCVK